MGKLKFKTMKIRIVALLFSISSWVAAGRFVTDCRTDDTGIQTSCLYLGRFRLTNSSLNYILIAIVVVLLLSLVYHRENKSVR